MRCLTGLTAVVVGGLSLTAPAFSHAVLSSKEAPAGSYYRLAIAITHGCEGSPTLRVRIRLPEGILSAKPQPKAGWELALRKQPLPQPVRGPHGSTVTETAAEATWSGKLPDEYFDEFVMQVLLPDKPGQTIYFPTVQECERGTLDWVEVPDSAQPAGHLKMPAPALRLMPQHGPHAAH